MLKILHIVFASYRLTQLLISEDGPFDIFKKLRFWVGIVEIEEKNVDEYGINYTNIRYDSNSVIGDIFLCPFCLSGYIVPLFMIVYLVNKTIVEWMGYWGLVYFLMKDSSDD